MFDNGDKAGQGPGVYTVFDQGHIPAKSGPAAGSRTNEFPIEQHDFNAKKPK